MGVTLKRALGFNRLVAVTMGTPLASSVFVSILLMVFTAGDLASLLLGIVICTGLVVMASFSYGELASIYPSAAGNRVFLKKPLGDRTALILSLMWIFVILGAAGVESFVLGVVLNFMFPWLPAFAWSLISLTAIVLVNLMGVELSGNFQTVITYFIAAVLIVVSLIAIAGSPSGTVALGPLDPVAALSAAAVGVYFFLGFGRVTTLGEEAVDFKRGIPKAMPVGVLTLGVVFLLVSTAIYERVPYSGLLNTVTPQILLGKYMIPNANFAILLAVISAIMSFSTFNAGILGTSRLVYALGREGSLPKSLGKIESRHFTPYAALLFLYFTVIIFVLLVYLTRNFFLPLIVAAGFDSFMYALIGYSAYWHKKRVGEGETPFTFRGFGAMYIATAVLFTLLGIAALTIQVYAAPVIVLSLLILLLYVTVSRRWNRHPS